MFALCALVCLAAFLMFEDFVSNDPSGFFFFYIPAVLECERLAVSL